MYSIIQHIPSLTAEAIDLCGSRTQVLGIDSTFEFQLVEIIDEIGVGQ